MSFNNFSGKIVLLTPQREKMIQETVARILQAEEEARKKIEEAKKQAEKELLLVEAQARQLVEKTRQQTLREIEETRRREKQQWQMEKEQMLEQLRSEVQNRRNKNKQVLTALAIRFFQELISPER